MKIRSWPGPQLAVVMFGVYLTMSSKVVTFSCVRVSLVSAWIVIGTSCRFSVRRCAVTVISDNSVLPAAPASVD
jgi:hypothetical protein